MMTKGLKLFLVQFTQNFLCLRIQHGVPKSRFSGTYPGSLEFQFKPFMTTSLRRFVRNKGRVGGIGVGRFNITTFMTNGIILHLRFPVPSSNSIGGNVGSRTVLVLYRVKDCETILFVYQSIGSLLPLLDYRVPIEKGSRRKQGWYSVI